MNTITKLATALALTIGGTAVQAAEYARVLSSSPIFNRVSTSEEVCYLRGYYHRDRDSGREGAVLGAIVGGALGNQVGRGDGRRAATVAGAVAGAVIGRDIDRRDRHRYDCDRRPIYRNAIVGYDVTYRYRGRTYYGQVPYQPGRRIPVVVYNYRGRYDVEPLDRI